MSTKNVRLYHFLLGHTLPWYAFGLRARDQKNLCFVVVVFLVAIKRLSLSPPSFLRVWDRYCCVVSGEINWLKARNSAPFSWPFRCFWESGSWYGDRIWANMPTTPGESNGAESSSTATPPRPEALQQIFTPNVPVPSRLDRCDQKNPQKKLKPICICTLHNSWYVCVWIPKGRND